jgi:thiaminase/transcriptional activator TenA
MQDFYFVREFARFGAALLAKAPHEAFDLLLGGLAALQDELRWFQVGGWVKITPSTPLPDEQ